MKNDLGLIIKNGQVVVSSKDVSEVYSKRHDQVLRDIRNIIEVVPEAAHNFVECNYIGDNNKTLPMYEMDRQGFSMLVMGFNGRQAKEFTYKYTLAFEKMAKQIEKPRSIEDLIIMQAQSMKDVKNQIALTQSELSITKKQVTNIKETIIFDTKKWRNDINKIMKKIGAKLGDYKRPWNESYERLESRGKCNLERRLENLLVRLVENGAPKKAINELCYLDVIDQDERLKQIYIGIAKEMSIRYLD